MANYLDLRRQREQQANLTNPGTAAPNNAVQNAQQTMQAAMMPVTTAMAGTVPAQPIVLNQQGQNLIPHIDQFGRMAYANPAQVQNNQVTPNPKVTVPNAQRPGQQQPAEQPQNNVTVQAPAQGGGTFTRNANDANEQDRVGNKSIAEMTPDERAVAMQRGAAMQRVATNPVAKAASALTAVVGVPAGFLRTMAANIPDQMMRDFNSVYGTGYESIQDFDKLTTELSTLAERMGIAKPDTAAMEVAAGRDANKDFGSRFSGGFDYGTASRNQGRGGAAPVDSTAGDRSRTPAQQTELYSPVDRQTRDTFGLSDSQYDRAVEQARQDIANNPDVFGGGSDNGQNESDRGNGTGGPDRESAQGARGL